MREASPDDRCAGQVKKVRRDPRDSGLWNIQEPSSVLIRRHVRYIGIFVEAALVVPQPATKARTETHRIKIVGAVGTPTNARDVLVNGGLPSHI